MVPVIQSVPYSSWRVISRFRGYGMHRGVDGHLFGILIKRQGQGLVESPTEETSRGVSWADFRKEFSEKFYPKSYRDARVEEFFRLEQGSMFVADYERRFSELIKAMSYIADNEKEKANRFAVGLNPKIRAYVASAAHTQYRALVEAATRVEKSMAVIPRSQPQKRSWSGLQSSQASLKPVTGSRGTTESIRTRPLCSRCGRNHTGSAGRLQGRPVRAGANREVVSSLEGLAVQVSPVEELVGVDHLGDSQGGPILRDAYVLIDPEATHSFVSMGFAANVSI
ncbi:hypothetical protein JRO89_XS09G0100800 [Xanthoceras sorbifolium]|uniref:Retrotransposon gag domain-containing protein n=1 Tax=Xanthoceras sorbifolium TaxID=99658 RepID=A0ABQ8HKX0_9ROSI|nr:hypothetical protein JRO89_XS09G0100800 [Xanthoceras sorbifolium]